MASLKSVGICVSYWLTPEDWKESTLSVLGTDNRVIALCPFLMEYIYGKRECM